jgi:hypothetical protein
MESTIEQRRAQRARRMRRGGVKRLLAATTALAMLTVAAPAAAGEEYDESYTGHPLRIIAYVLHPVGVILDTLIFKPFHWIGGHEPIKTLVGQED